LHEWQLSSSDCYGNCSCPSKQYVNEYDQSANGCANAADCSACQTSCVEDLYANRSFVAFNSSEINKIDFNYILETDETTLRKSADGSLTFVKWTGSTPSFIQNLTTKQNTSGYNQLSSDINSSGWSESSAQECNGITNCGDLCTCLGWFGECTISCDSENSADVTYGGVTCRCSH
jgi:hypothetical protein